MDVDGAVPKKRKNAFGKAVTSKGKHVPSSNRATSGLRDGAQREKARQLTQLSQRGPNRLAKASESDRHVPTKMPPHLFKGKRVSTFMLFVRICESMGSPASSLNRSLDTVRPTTGSRASSPMRRSLRCHASIRVVLRIGSFPSLSRLSPRRCCHSLFPMPASLPAGRSIPCLLYPAVDASHTWQTFCNCIVRSQYSDVSYSSDVLVLWTARNARGLYWE